MGLIAPPEVPDFFILRNLVPGRARTPTVAPSSKPTATKVTIQDVIAAEGPRVPDVEHSQRKFNTGIVVVVEHGKNPEPRTHRADERHPPAVDGLLGNHHRTPRVDDDESMINVSRVGLFRYLPSPQSQANRN